MPNMLNLIFVRVMVKSRYVSVCDTISLFSAGASGPRGCVGCVAGFGQKVGGYSSMIVVNLLLKEC